MEMLSHEATILASIAMTVVDKICQKTPSSLDFVKNRENFLRGASAKRFGKSVKNRLKSILKLIFRVF